LPKPRDQWTTEEWRDTTEDARRSARFKFAADRIRRIVDGAPPLTDEQRAKLALLLHPGLSALEASTPTAAGEPARVNATAR
jgi:hypothetical protein